MYGKKKKKKETEFRMSGTVRVPERRGKNWFSDRLETFAINK